MMTTLIESDEVEEYRAQQRRAKEWRKTRFARMLELRFGYFPKLFSVDGNTYAVRNVQRVFEHKTARIFRVETEQGMFDLRINVRKNEWTCTPFVRDS